MALTILAIHIGNDIVQYAIRELILIHLYFLSTNEIVLIQRLISRFPCASWSLYKPRVVEQK